MPAPWASSPPAFGGWWVYLAPGTPAGQSSTAVLMFFEVKYSNSIKIKSRSSTGHATRLVGVVCMSSGRSSELGHAYAQHTAAAVELIRSLLMIRGDMEHFFMQKFNDDPSSCPAHG